MIYYTGASKPEQPQDNPSLSLGGFKSSSQVPNGYLHNVFPKITQSTIIKNRKIIRMIALHNPSPNVMRNIRLWSRDGEFSTITIAALLPGFDPQCSQLFFEAVSSEENLPYQGSLQSYSELTPLIIEELQANQYVGIWLRKELDLTKFNALDKGLDDQLSCDQLIEIMKQPTVEDIQDEVEIHIEWD